MSFQHKTATLFAVLLTTTLLSSCVGLGVAIPHTRHETLSPNDYVNKQNMVRSRADIINRHGEPDTFQIRTVDDRHGTPKLRRVAGGSSGLPQALQDSYAIRPQG